MLTDTALRIIVQRNLLQTLPNLKSVIRPHPTCFYCFPYAICMILLTDCGQSRLCVTAFYHYAHVRTVYPYILIYDDALRLGYSEIKHAVR